MRIRDESGQTLVLMALLLTILMGFMALAIDVGILFRAKRKLQIVADAAAVAGALDYSYNGSALSAQAAGQAAATANGVTNGTSGAVVTISIPPTDGPNAGATGFVEADVSQPNPTFFMKIFLSAGVTVVARAVAGKGASNACVWTLGQSGVDINNTGSGNITIPGCMIYDDSSSSNALRQTGSGSITAKSIGIVGGYSNVGSGNITPKPTTGMTYVSDPLSSLQAPSISSGSGCQSAQSFTGSGAHSLGPGCYNGISNTGSGALTLTPGDYVINGNFANTGSGTLNLGAGNYTINGSFSNVGSGALNLGAGLYITNGNFSNTGSGPMSGTDVSFYTTGKTSVTGSGSVNLTAPTSGADNGILFFQSRSDAQAISITGSSNLNLKGIIYAPAAQLNFTGSGAGTIYTDLVVNSLNFTGSTSFQDYALINTSTPLAKTVMVE